MGNLGDRGVNPIPLTNLFSDETIKNELCTPLDSYKKIGGSFFEYKDLVAQQLGEVYSFFRVNFDN